MKTSTYFMHFVMLENMLLNDCFDTTVRTNAFTLVMENSERSWKTSWKVMEF